jgi:cytidylate kinase
MIITIDGPAGAGKSSAARGLAQRLGFEFLDTGAMYRAVTLALLRRQVPLSATDAVAELLAGMHFELSHGRVVFNGEDVTTQIRTAEVTAASGAVADCPAVRHALADWQRRLAAGRNVVCEGRDQGTVVFPNAECKFFLEADPLERAHRRQREMAERGEARPLDEVLRAQEVRDRRDAERTIAPMVPAPDALRLDSTHLSPEAVVQQLEREVRQRLGLDAP